MVKVWVLEGAIDLPSSFSPRCFSKVPRSFYSIPFVKSNCCHFSLLIGPSRVNKFPSRSFGVVSYPIGVVSPVVRPSQELEGDSFLMLSQNRPDKSSFPEKIKCHFRRLLSKP